MGKSWIEKRNEDPQDRRLFEQERLIMWVTEAIAERMEEMGVQKADLADRLGTSRAHITQVLSGSRNMTLRTLADLSWALGMMGDFSLQPLRYGEFISTPLKMLSKRTHIVMTEEDSSAGGISPDELAA